MRFSICDSISSHSLKVTAFSPPPGWQNKKHDFHDQAHPTQPFKFHELSAQNINPPIIPQQSNFTPHTDHLSTPKRAKQRQPTARAAAPNLARSYLP